MWEAHNWSKFRKQKVEVEEEKTIKRPQGHPPPYFPAMMNVLMGEIIYSWSSLVLRDLWGQPVQLLQFTNEKAETGEVRWLATPPKPLRAKLGQRTWSSDFRDLFTEPLWSSPHCWLNDWACFLFHPLPCSLRQEVGCFCWAPASCTPAERATMTQASRTLMGLLPFLCLFASLPVCFPPCLNSLLMHRSFSVSSQTHSILWLLSVLLFSLLDTAFRILFSNMFLLSDPKVVRCVNSGKCRT